jgi:hypothetical protein
MHIIHYAYARTLILILPCKCMYGAGSRSKYAGGVVVCCMAVWLHAWSSCQLLFRLLIKTSAKGRLLWLVRPVPVDKSKGKKPTANCQAQGPGHMSMPRLSPQAAGCRLAVVVVHGRLATATDEGNVDWSKTSSAVAASVASLVNFTGLFHFNGLHCDCDGVAMGMLTMAVCTHIWR